MNVFPVFLGGYDIAETLASHWAEQQLLCNDFVHSAAYLITGPETEHELAAVLLTKRVAELGERPVVWVMDAQAIRFYYRVADFAANIVVSKPAGTCRQPATECKCFPVGGLLPFEWDSTVPFQRCQWRVGLR